MKLYRIFTQNTPEYKANAIRIMSNNFDSFTVLEGIGYWAGGSEFSLIFEIAVIDGRSAPLKRQVERVCRLIRVENEQEAVLIQELEVNATLIEAA